MTEIEVFQFPATGQQVRTVMVAGEPWFVAADVCAVLGVGNASQAVSYLDEDERTSTLITSEGGQGRPTNIVSEPGLYSLILRSRKAEAKGFKRWITHDVLPSIRRTGLYGREPTRLELIDLAREAEIERLAAIERAAVAEHRAAELEPAAQNWEAIEAGDGIALRTFHKKYFSDVPERRFFEHLYRHGYLIDQRGKGGWSERRQRNRDGAQHRHPSFKGKPYLYLHAAVDNQGVRRESVRVRSGQPELDFRTLLIREGLPPNQTGTDIERSAA